MHGGAWRVVGALGLTGLQRHVGALGCTGVQGMYGGPLGCMSVHWDAQGCKGYTGVHRVCGVN